MVHFIKRNLACPLAKYLFRNHPMAHKIKLISAFGINLIFDVGANIGQYAQRVRDWGFKGRIVSFEPLTSAHELLVKHAANDPLWDTVNIALGCDDCEAEINIAGNSYSSSILKMLPTHLKASPDSAYFGKELVRVSKFDSIIGEYYQANDRILLKMDAQGYEKHILEGARESLSKITGIELEMSFIPLYKGEALFAEMMDYLQQKGFMLATLEPGLRDPETRQLLQVDGVFFRAARW